MEIIPAIDIIDGKCVRLTQGKYDSKKVYHNDPLAAARMFEDWGLKRLHLVDLDGAREGRIRNYKVIETLASKTSLVLDFGGGLKSNEDVYIAFESGAAMVTGGSIAVKNPDLFLGWLEHYGSGRIILGADHKEGKIAVSGWEETSEQELLEFIRDYKEKGIKQVISTDISKDGMLAGPSLNSYREILDEVSGIHLVASGGVSGPDDLYALDEAGLHGVIIGKAIYEGRISDRDIRNFLTD